MGKTISVSSLLAIALVFSTVAPVSVSAEDTVKISNTVESSISTGGNSSRGADGTDGRDGTDGTSIATDGQSSVHVESYVDGELVERISETETSNSDVTLSATDCVVTTTPTTESDTDTENTLALLKKLLQQLQVMLTSYVDIF